MRFTAIIPVAAAFLAVVDAMPLLGKRATCNKAACGVAMTKELTPCVLAAAHHILGSFGKQRTTIQYLIVLTYSIDRSVHEYHLRSQHHQCRSQHCTFDVLKYHPSCPYYFFSPLHARTVFLSCKQPPNHSELKPVPPLQQLVHAF